MISPTYALWALLLLVGILLFNWILRWFHRQWDVQPMDRNQVEQVAVRFLDAIVCLFILLLVGGAWLAAIHDAQFSPHVITQSINGKVLSSVTVTNPAYVTWQTRSRITANGMVYFQEPKTNYYWTVWPCFKK